MLKSVINYMLMLMIVLQSVSLFADTHQAHQSGAQHLNFEHDHIPSSGIEAVIDQGQGESGSSESLDGQFDCHHCCHCHGTNLVAAIDNVLLDVSSYDSKYIISYSLEGLVSPPHQVYRPPRS